MWIKKVLCRFTNEFRLIYSVVFNHFIRSQSADLEPMEPSPSIAHQSNHHHHQHHDNQQKSVESQQQLDDNSTDSSSIDDESKKHRRKLRFPFGKKTFQKNKHIWYRFIVIGHKSNDATIEHL